MPRLTFPGFVSGSYTTRAIVHGSERTVNLIAEQNPSTQQLALYGTPGLKRRFTLPGTPIRGLYAATNGRVFAVAGRALVELFAAGSILSRGALEPLSTPVAMADNGLALLLVDGTGGYVLPFDGGSAMRVTDPDFPAATAVAFLDGYFVLNVPGTGQFMWTGLYDPTQVNGLDLATAEASADPLVTLAVDHRELWLFGTRTTEVWFNSGNPTQPFERIQGALLEEGCVAPGSVQALDSTLYWLQANTRGVGALVRAQGYQPETLTPPAVAWAWSQYPRVTDAVAYAYKQGGHAFYVVSFPQGQATWAYDVTTGLWHERAYLEADGTLGRHRAWCHTLGLGAHLVGDYATGVVYALDPHTYTDDGRELPRIRRAPHVASDGKRVVHAAFELGCEVGVGLDGAGVPGVDPQAMLEFSGDGGYTWSNQHWVTLGQIGDYKRRVIWRRLGQSRNRVYQITMTSPVSIALTGAWLDITEGRS